MSRARDVASNNLAVDTTPTLQGDLTMGSNSIADGVLPVKNNGTQSELRVYCEAGSHYVGLKSPAHSAFSGNHTITMPPNTGTSGQFLSTDGNGVTSWAAAGGGAWDLISTTVATGSGTLISIVDNFSSTYDNYQVVGTNMQPSSSPAVLYFRFTSGTNGGTVHQGSYNWVQNYSQTNSGTNNYRSHILSNFTYGGLTFESQTNSAYFMQSFVMDIFDPYGNLGFAHTNWQSSGAYTPSNTAVGFADVRGRWEGGASVNLKGLDLFYSSGVNINGRVSVYGQKKS